MDIEHIVMNKTSYDPCRLWENIGRPLQTYVYGSSVDHRALESHKAWKRVRS